MRKFRVWDRTKSRWIHDKVALMCNGSVFLVLPGNIIILLDSNHVVVQFCTDYVDKNEKEIYEGDLIQWPEQGVWSDQSGKITVVSYPYFCGNSRKGQIIGNICENRELVR